MMLLLATPALAAPVLEAPDSVDRFARCVAQAQAEADAEGFVWAAPGAHAQNVAVVAGVPCHRDEAIPSLSWSSRDAIRMAKMLQDAGYTVLPLVSDVTGADLEAALDRAAALVDPDGTLLVYFSGHGLLREEAGGLHRYLVLSDTDRRASDTSERPLFTQGGRIEQHARGPAEHVTVFHRRAQRPR